MSSFSHLTITPSLTYSIPSIVRTLLPSYCPSVTSSPPSLYLFPYLLLLQLVLGDESSCKARFVSTFLVSGIDRDPSIGTLLSSFCFSFIILSLFPSNYLFFCIENGFKKTVQFEDKSICVNINTNVGQESISGNCDAVRTPIPIHSTYLRSPISPSSLYMILFPSLISSLLFFPLPILFSSFFLPLFSS